MSGPVSVVLVDDHQIVREGLRTLFADEPGIRVVGEAGGAAEGFDVAAALRPDVVLLDIGMPKLNGYDVCRQIREQPWGRDILIVAVTGWGQEGDKRRAREAGFDHHLTKPVDPADLQKLLASVLV